MIKLKRNHIFAICGITVASINLILLQPHWSRKQPFVESKIKFKTHERRKPNPPPVLSDYQMNRIRSAVKNASVSINIGDATVIFDELLKTRDLDVLHEAVTQVRNEEKTTGNSRLKEALMQSIINQFSGGNFPSMGKIIDASFGDGPIAGDFVQLLCQRLSDNNLELGKKAYYDLLKNPPQTVDPLFYVDIAAGAGDPNSLGPVKALDLIPDPSDGWFGTAAARKIVELWIYLDAVQASTYIKDLPDSEYRDGLVKHMVRYTAENNDIEMATMWANSLTGSARIFALDLLRQISDHAEKINNTGRK